MNYFNVILHGAGDESGDSIYSYNCIPVTTTIE